MGNLYDFHFIKLVQTVQSAYILAVGTGFPAETGRIGHVFHRKILTFQDGIAVNVGHRHFCCRNEIEIIESGIVHLGILIWQLPCGIS